MIESEEPINGVYQEIFDRCDLINMKECFKCNAFIHLYDFYVCNELSFEHSKKIWISKYVELLCCSCFNELKFYNMYHENNIEFLKW